MLRTSVTVPSCQRPCGASHAPRRCTRSQSFASTSAEPTRVGSRATLERRRLSRTARPSMRTLSTTVDGGRCGWLTVGGRRSRAVTGVLVAARVAALCTLLGFRLSAGFAGPVQSVACHLTRPGAALATLASRTNPTFPEAVVSKVLARSAELIAPDGQPSEVSGGIPGEDVGAAGRR